jgi:hypothetical protein
MGVACEYKAKYTRGQAPAIESALGNNGTEPSKLSELNNNTSRLSSRRRSSARSSSEQVSDEQEPDDEITIREQYEEVSRIQILLQESVDSKYLEFSSGLQYVDTSELVCLDHFL